MKFFVIGLGSIGTRHARNLIALGHTVWGYDKSVEIALQVKEQLPGLEIAADMFDCDAYVICTPPDQHIAEIMNAVEAGKHIFVEKPIGVPADIERLSELLDEAKRKNLVVMVGNMLRFHPEVRKVNIKNPQQADFNVLQKNERYTEDIILQWGAHEIDLALYLLGPAKVVRAFRHIPTLASVVLQHGKQAVSSLINMDYLSEPEIRQFKIKEWDGSIHKVDLRLPDWNDVYMDEMKEFVERIYDKQHFDEWHSLDWVGATGEDGLATLKIIAEAMRMVGG